MGLDIRNAELEGRRVDVRIEGGRISSIEAAGTSTGPEDPHTIGAEGNYLVPALKNGHGHAAMTLLRGFADDMKLQPWLEEKIWPAEAALTPEDIYWGTRLAALEMIHSGTVFYNDMYFFFPQAYRAYQDAGIKAAVGPALFDFFDEAKGKEVIEENRRLFEEYGGKNERIIFSPAPHSIYTVSERTLRWAAEFSRENGLPLHIHLCETEKEVEDCLAAHGKRPAEYLADIGFLGPNVAAAHAVWLSDREIELLAESGSTVVHNPASNMKLASGSCFPYRRLKEAGVPMMLGTDGCSSNNNLDMFEEMKIAALLQKHHFGDPEVLPAEEIFAVAAGAWTAASGAVPKVFPYLSGKVEEGAHADLLLIDRNHPSMVPAHNLTSNLVYAGGGGAVDTVICNGEVLLQKGKIDGEEEVIEEARGRAEELRRRIG
jgi:5-methylthioadenosine/S-adenosylhomocysteine deaminase